MAGIVTPRMLPVVGVVLAAGQGTRMKSALPKVLHDVCGLSMVEWVVGALRAGGVDRVIVVIGHGGELVRERLAYLDLEFVEQTERLGTGHAVMMAAPLLEGHEGLTLVSAGDTPLLQSDTIKELIGKCGQDGVSATLSTAELEDPGSYGRIIRDNKGDFQAIVEAKDCTPDQKKVKEWNPALYCFRTAELLAALPRLKNTNSQGEYYLTDVLGDLVGQGKSVKASLAPDPVQFSGVNDRWHLAQVAQVKKEAILRHHAENGVTIIDPSSTLIEAEVQIGYDAVIHPNTVITGRTTIASGADVGPNSWIKSSHIGPGCRVFMSHLDHATMEAGSRCGPFANLRPEALLGPKVKVGNFVEIKNSQIGEKTSISHLTYIGDAEVGRESNIGAGTITCNYDGIDKYRTYIGDRSFVGSNSTLVAPVRIESDAFVAAGSVISHDVPEGAMAIGRGKQENKLGWFTAWRLRKQGQKV
ncbi:MAG: bifunctional UDP-N-acetylglucosamine diphosphorylase/glucosamine-1-phosphate N-acetyltransferase GlmU [Armatimonadota bacterium]